MPLEFDKGIAVVLHAQIPTESPPPPLPLIPVTKCSRFYNYYRDRK